MYSRAGLFVGLMAALLTGGCGTAVNTLGYELNPPFRTTTPQLEDTDTSLHGTNGTIGPLWHVSEEHQKRIYGGVMDDIEILWAARSSMPQHDIDPLWALFDIPFSALGDTITLPYILAYQNSLTSSAKASSADSYLTPPVESFTPPAEPPK
ncbi:MAG TPA: hypothetical protein VG122_07930 [Gemmata sp.]|jgi:uncharacterized protein YceK|nr:hypothetical protein [Gemmata sp.]